MTEVLRAVAEPTKVVVDLDGRPSTVSVRVFNLSGIVDGYRIDAPTAPRWLRVEPADVRLLPGTDGTAEVVLAVPDVAGVPAHDTSVRLRVRSIADPDVAHSLHLDVSVPASAADVALTLEPAMLRGERATARLTAHNQAGNVPVQLQLRGSDPEGVVRFQFAPATMHLAPGQTTQAQVQVQAPPVRAGDTEQRRQLTITALEGQSSYATSGTLVQQPPTVRDPFPVKPLLRVVLTVLGAAMLLYGTVLPWTVAPIARAGFDWHYLALCEMLNATCPQVREDLFLPLFVLSAGVPVLVLAVMALFGLLGGGAMTRFAGIAAVLFMLAFVAVLIVVGANAGLAAGVLVVIAGGIIAAVGGVLARP